METYICEDHMGGSLYTSQFDQSFEELYCEECGDSDRRLGIANDKKEAENLLKNSGYDADYIEEFINREFPEEEE